MNTTETPFAPRTLYSLLDILAADKKPIKKSVKDWFSGRALITQLDMIRFLMSHFTQAEFLIQWLRKDCYEADMQSEGKAVVSTMDRERIIRDLATVNQCCNALHLVKSVAQIEHIYDQFRLSTPPRYGAIATLLHALWHSISNESDDRHFAFIPPERVEFFERTDLFGPPVALNFSKANHDIKEAGNCLAADANAAAVFHLMRVMECGLYALHKKLSAVPPSSPNWSGLISDIEKSIEARDKPVFTWSNADERQLYYDAARHFRFFKEPRNAAVHVEYGVTQYVPPDHGTALRIFDEVKHFMQHLATNGISE